MPIGMPASLAVKGQYVQIAILCNRREKILHHTVDFAGHGYSCKPLAYTPCDIQYGFSAFNLDPVSVLQCYLDHNAHPFHL